VGLHAVYFQGDDPHDTTPQPGTALHRWWWRTQPKLRQPRQLLQKNWHRLQQWCEPSYALGTTPTRRCTPVYNALFTDPWDRIADPHLPCKFVGRDFDTTELSEQQPDLTIVFGTTILPPPVITVARTACLNLHWGLSPYYRGTHCTDWAILNHDLANIGVTVHLLDPGIDSGPILAQARPTITPNDTPFSIDMKLSVRGTDLLISCLEKLAAGRTLLARPQAAGIGQTYFLKQWTHHTDRRLARILDRGRVAPLLDTPAAPKQPIYTGESRASDHSHARIEIASLFPPASQRKAA
jgi:hypothetical protein